MKKRPEYNGDRPHFSCSLDEISGEVCHVNHPNRMMAVAFWQNEDMEGWPIWQMEITEDKILMECRNDRNHLCTIGIADTPEKAKEAAMEAWKGVTGQTWEDYWI